jgi:hypothetical protein
MKEIMDIFHNGYASSKRELSQILIMNRLGIVAQTCNPSNLGGRPWEDGASRPA